MGIIANCCDARKAQQPGLRPGMGTYENLIPYPTTLAMHCWSAVSDGSLCCCAGADLVQSTTGASPGRSFRPASAASTCNALATEGAGGGCAWGAEALHQRKRCINGSAASTEALHRRKHCVSGSAASTSYRRCDRRGSSCLSMRLGHWSGSAQLIALQLPLPICSLCFFSCVHFRGGSGTDACRLSRAWNRSWANLANRRVWPRTVLFQESWTPRGAVARGILSRGLPGQ